MPPRLVMPPAYARGTPSLPPPTPDALSRAGLRRGCPRSLPRFLVFPPRPVTASAYAHAAPGHPPPTRAWRAPAGGRSLRLHRRRATARRRFRLRSLYATPCHGSCLPTAARSAPRLRFSGVPPTASPGRCAAVWRVLRATRSENATPLLRFQVAAPLHSELAVNVPASGFASSPLRGAVHGSRAYGAANSLFRSALPPRRFKRPDATPAIARFASVGGSCARRCAGPFGGRPAAFGVVALRDPRRIGRGRQRSQITAGACRAVRELALKMRWLSAPAYGLRRTASRTGAGSLALRVRRQGSVSAFALRRPVVSSVAPRPPARAWCSASSSRRRRRAAAAECATPTPSCSAYGGPAAQNATRCRAALRFCGVRPTASPERSPLRGSLSTRRAAPAMLFPPARFSPLHPPFRASPLQKRNPAGGQTFLGGNSTAAFTARPRLGAF